MSLTTVQFILSPPHQIPNKSFGGTLYTQPQNKVRFFQKVIITGRKFYSGKHKIKSKLLNTINTPSPLQRDSNCVCVGGGGENGINGTVFRFVFDTILQVQQFLQYRRFHATSKICGFQIWCLKLFADFLGKTGFVVFFCKLKTN